MLKLETYPLELGLNSMKLEHKMAELVDKKGVMFTDFLLHREYEELKEVWWISYFLQQNIIFLYKKYLNILYLILINQIY